MSRWLVALALMLGGATQANAGDDLFEARRWLMGTELRLVIAQAPDERAVEIAERCFARVAAIEESLSTWIASSPLSRLNASAGQRVRASASLAAFVQRCIDDHVRTDGAFDPSVGTWRGLDASASRPKIGMQRVVIERVGEEHWITLPFAGFALDSGGNGKGIAVDAMVAELRRGGVTSALIDFGGSSWYGLGAPPAADQWVVQVPGPAGFAPREVRLHDRALSVSSSIQTDTDEIGVEIERPHIFDPRTGVAIVTPRVAVVTSRSAEDAEVLSTALIVEGAAGLRWVERYEAAHAFVMEADGSVVESERH